MFDRYKLPAFHDPFAGGGSLPLEAQRLGLEVYASDLNPVAVLINKAMIEIPPKFAGCRRSTLNPSDNRLIAKEWPGGQGLAEDVRYYGKWMRVKLRNVLVTYTLRSRSAKKWRPSDPISRPLVGQKLTVIAWLWARTVKSPNPAFANVDVPLATNFVLATKPGKEAYVEHG